MVLVLTVCDIRAVGPGVWNGWKGQLLRTLFWETEIVLAAGGSFRGSTALSAFVATKMGYAPCFAELER